jgi:hypothetical protein
VTKAQLIPPDAYPQLVSKDDAAKISRALRSREAVTRGASVIRQAVQKLREGARDYMRELEDAIGDHQITSDKAHEICGFAETTAACPG